MVAEVFAGIGAFKSMLDMAKSLKDMSDATIRNGAVIELQGQILSAQADQMALVERIQSLEAKVANFETWDTEKKRYELKNLGWGAQAYMLKPEARGGEPAHWVCPNCFSDRKIKIIQHAMVVGRGTIWICPTCRTETQAPQTAFERGNPKLLD